MGYASEFFGRTVLEVVNSISEYSVCLPMTEYVSTVLAVVVTVRSRASGVEVGVVAVLLYSCNSNI